MSVLPASRTARLVAVSIGQVTELPYRGGAIRSGILKAPVDGVVWASSLGLLGDEQGDQARHGGRDKAICAFPDEHYPYYQRLLRRRLKRPAFGENLTTQRLCEEDVCIGDVLSVGAARLEVSLPRNPCYRLAARHGVRRLPLWFERSGRTGFYLRVLEPGELGVGCPIELVHRRYSHATVAEANRVMHRDKRDWHAIEALLAISELGGSWRRTFERRLAVEPEDPTLRRYGPAAEAT